MNAMRGTILSLAAALSGLACTAQNTTIPIRQIERDSQTVQLHGQLTAEASVPASEAAVGLLSGASAGFTQPRPAAKSPRTLSSGFFLLNGLHLGMAILDVEMTQHCIRDHHCVEGNPLMPSSHAGQLGVNFAFAGWGSFMSYKMKKQESKMWVLSPTVGITAHTIGVVSGLRNR